MATVKDTNEAGGGIFRHSGGISPTVIEGVEVVLYPKKVAHNGSWEAVEKAG